MFGTVKTAGNFCPSPTTIACSINIDSFSLFSACCGAMYNVDFDTQEVKVGNRTNIDIIIGGRTELGEVVVIGKWYTPRGVWWRVKGFFGRVF